MTVFFASLSSICGLLATFLQERERRHDGQQQATIEEYTEWLRRGEHTEIVSLLESNHALASSVQRLLTTGHDELINRFDRLENMLNLVLGATEDWGALVRSIEPNAGLSAQSLEILRWFDASGASMVIQVATREGVVLLPNKGRGNYTPSENRFFEDDMAALVGLGLLIPGYGSRGSPNFTFTRAAADLVRSLPMPAEHA